ncbi:MAG: hypothetical protein ALAOOOJD_00397 [bacterium]|nr:hypothetical protein [bacterium]
MFPKNSNRLLPFAFCLLLFAFYWACGEKYPLPNIPNDPNSGLNAAGDTLYLQLTPVWNAANGYNFKAPEDVYADKDGLDPFVYVADTGNDRVVMMTPAGRVLGSISIPHPTALTQDRNFNLLVVNNTNRIYKINLVAANHVIAAAPVDTVKNLIQLDHPEWQFTGIAAYEDFRYYVTRTDASGAASAIISFSGDNNYEGPLPLVANGTGLLATARPSAIVAERLDGISFIFAQIGNNSFKVQWLTTSSDIGFVPKIHPSSDPESESVDLFRAGKFRQPEDVAVDRANNLLVIDAASDSLFRFNSGGTEDPAVSFGGSGNGERQFRHPMGVAWSDRTVYVADTGNNRIVRFQLSTELP